VALVVEMGPALPSMRRIAAPAWLTAPALRIRAAKQGSVRLANPNVRAASAVPMAVVVTVASAKRVGVAVRRGSARHRCPAVAMSAVMRMRTARSVPATVVSAAAMRSARLNRGRIA